MPRTRPTNRPLAVILGTLAAGAALAGGSRPEVAPCAPEVLDAPSPANETPARPAKVDGVTEYSHGDPSNEEQYFLELMNRARGNPPAEADRILDDYGSTRVKQSVDFFVGARPGVEWTRQENHDAFDAYPAQPPFALNAQLLAAARYWSQVQIDENVQEHAIGNYPQLGQRVQNQSYAYSALAESIYAYASNTLHAHAALAIDWGQGILQGQSRPNLGHRESLMNFNDLVGRDYKEVGVAVLSRPNPGQGDVGPNVCTIDFASPTDGNRRFVVGVCYSDENGNGICDPGEGIEGVRVDADTSSFYAVTSSSGGYAIPVGRTDGAIEVTTTPTSAPGSQLIGQQALMVSTFDFDGNGGNTKADFVVPPAPPAPDFTHFDGAPGTIPAPGSLERTFVVGELSADSAVVGEVRLYNAISVVDRTNLRVTLESPDGTNILLYGGSTPGADLNGTFGGSLRSWLPLSNFVGKAYQGTWKVRFTGTSAGAAGTLNAVRLSIRPGWVRPLATEQSGLFVSKLKLKDSDVPEKDVLVLKAEVEAGVALGGAAGGQLHLILREPDGDRDELLHVDLSETTSAKAATLVGTSQSVQLDVGRSGTSRGVLVAKVKGLDLPALPDEVDVELALGDAIVGTRVRLAGGTFAGTRTSPESPLFRVEKYVSKVAPDGTQTIVIKGRMTPLASDPDGLVELRIGDVAFSRTTEFFQKKGTRLIYKGAGVPKFVIDPATGTFAAKLVVDNARMDAGTLNVSLRVGDDLGAMDFTPVDVNGKHKY